MNKNKYGKSIDKYDIVDRSFYKEINVINNTIAARDLALRLILQIICIYFFASLFYISIYYSLLFFYFSSVVIGFWGYAGIGHEFFHSRVFSSRRFNKFFYYFSSALVWNNPYFFSRSHSIHHSATFSARDMEASSLQRWTPLYIFLYLTFDVNSFVKKIGYAIMNSFGFTFSERSFIKIGFEIQKCAFIVILFNLFFHLLVFASFRSFLINLFFLAMPFTGQFINRVLAQAQHLGLKAMAGKGPLEHSRTIFLPKAFEFLYASMNYHAEHHLAPAVPYYNLHRMNTYLRDKGIDNGVHWKVFICKDFWRLVKASA